jgi:hypothetical protein
MIFQFALCFRVASDSRHDHANGTLMILPSISSATMLSLVMEICLILASCIFAAMLIPGLHNLFTVSFNKFTEHVKPK